MKSMDDQEPIQTLPTEGFRSSSNSRLKLQREKERLLAHIFVVELHVHYNVLDLADQSSA